MLALVLLAPYTSIANPVMIDGQSAIAFAIVAFWALVVESGLVTLSLSFCGILIMPLFATLLTANMGVFVFGFLPLNGRLPLWALESLVVLVDALLIRTLLALPLFQGGDFTGVTWRRSLVASLVGNGASFFVGVLAGYSPWFEPKNLASE